VDRHGVMESSDSTSTPSTTWHIVWQAAEGRDLLANPALVDRIRLRLLDAHRPPDRALLHYLLTPTELHLLSRLPSGKSPGDVARAIGNIVARWVRQAQGASGMVFAGRYRAYAIESDEAARNEFRMLAWRPVVLRLCRAPTHYSNSTLRTALGLKRAMGFDALTPLRLFGDSVPAARTALRGRIAKRPGAVEFRQWELTRGMVRAAGYAGTFSLMTRQVQGMAAALVAASQPQGIDGALRLLERWVLLKLGCRGIHSLAALSSPAGARGRALVASLAVQLDLCSAASVARHFKRAKATLSERMAACRLQPENQSILGTPLRRIVEEAIDLRNSPSGAGAAASSR
jgi:hypothetical protein